MRRKEKIEVHDIQNIEISRTIVISDKNIHMRLQNAKTGIVDGKREILDEILINNMFEQIARALKQNYSKYNVLPEEVILRNAFYKKESQEVLSEQSTENVNTGKNLIESYEPRFELEHVAMEQKNSERIKTIISAVRYKEKMFEEWGLSEKFIGNRPIVLNFYGKPGTGKSMAAEGVAKYLGKKVYHVNYSQLESKYVGETPKNIRKVFECATRDDAVLIFDEADSFLGKRLSSVTQSADYGVNITRSVLLMEIEKFTGVLVFTTNLISNYDEAFKRRILLSVHFEMPDEQAREMIWKLHLSDKMPLHSEITPESLASKYDEVSGADIKDMVFYAALYALEYRINEINFDVFDRAYKTIRERYKNLDDEQKFRVISTETLTEEEYQRDTRGNR